MRWKRECSMKPWNAPFRISRSSGRIRPSAPLRKLRMCSTRTILRKKMRDEAMTESKTLLLAAKCFEDGGPFEDWLFENGALIGAALRAAALKKAEVEAA